MAIQANTRFFDQLDRQGTVNGHAPSNLLKRLKRLFSDFSKAKQASHDVEQLMGLSDRELRDMGIYRGDIARITYERHFGKF